VATALEPLIERRASLLARLTGEQRKLVTVLFADLVDFAVLSGRLDAEDVRTIVDAYFQRWHHHVELNGGVIEKYIGDAVMAVYGSHIAHEHDPHSAIRTAQSMIGELQALNVGWRSRFGVELQMRVGIDTGDVVVSTLGERPGQDLVVIGEIVNRASRLQSAAPPGGILISADTHRHVRGAFGFQPVPGLQLKGIPGTVDAYLALDERPHRFRLDSNRGVEGIETSTVGRDIELRQLQERLWDITEDRHWQVVTVMGDAGVGKTRLLLEFDRWLAEIPDRVWWFRGRASPLAVNQAGGLLRDVLAARFDIEESDSDEIVAGKLLAGLEIALGPAPATSSKADLIARWLGFGDRSSRSSTATHLDPLVLRQQALVAIGEYFAGLSRIAPVVILAEDLHWSDDVSLDCLDAGDSVLHDARVLVVATARPSLLDRRPHWGEGLSHHVRMTLEPLSRRDSRALVKQLLARVDAVPPTMIDVILGEAEGNPFYIEELVKWLIDANVIVCDDDQWRVNAGSIERTDVPSTLRGVLQARVDALDASERSVVQRASVLGRVFWDDAVDHLAPELPRVADEALATLRRREVVYQRERSAFDATSEFVFKHALLRDVVYDGVLRAHRSTFHQRAAAWLQEITERTSRVDEFAAMIAGHLDHANASDAAVWYLRAARRASSVYAITEASRLVARGLEIVAADDRETKFDLLAVSQELNDWQGDRAAQEANLRAMEEMSPQLDVDRQVTALLGRAQFAFVHSLYDQQVENSTRAADLAAAAGLDLREAEAELLLGKGLVWRSHHDEARRVLNRALTKARANRQRPIVGEVLRYLSMAASNQGELTHALELLDEAFAVHESTGDVHGQSTVLAQRATVYFHLGRYAEARDCLEQTLPLFRSSGNRYREAVALSNLASITLRQGQYGEARRRAEQALEIMPEIDEDEAAVTCYVVLGEVCASLGQLPEADEHLRRGLEVAQRADALHLVAETLMQLTLTAIAAGDSAAALSLAEQATDAAKRCGLDLICGMANLINGLAWSSAGEDATAEHHMALAVEHFAGLEVPAQVRGAQAAQALVAHRRGDLTRAVSLAGRAADGLTLELVDAALQPAPTLIDLWEVLEAAGDPRADEVARLVAEFVRVHTERIDDEDLRALYVATPVQRELRRIAQRE